MGAKSAGRPTGSSWVLVHLTLYQAGRWVTSLEGASAGLGLNLGVLLSGGKESPLSIQGDCSLKTRRLGRVDSDRKNLGHLEDTAPGWSRRPWN